MADSDIRKTVTDPKKDKVTNEPIIGSGSSTDSSDSDVTGGETSLADEAPEVDEAAPVLAIVPGDVAESDETIIPTGNTPDAVQFPVVAPRLPGIYLDDVEKYQDEVRSAVVEDREPDQTLNPLSNK